MPPGRQSRPLLHQALGVDRRHQLVLTGPDDQHRPPQQALAAALEFVAAVDHAAAGVLIDLMHLNRCGEPLPSLDAGEFSYVQACDFFHASATLTGDAYIEAAVDGRCPLGEGEARKPDIEAVCRSSLDVSLEIRSKALRDACPDVVERAARIFARCKRAAFL